MRECCVDVSPEVVSRGLTLIETIGPMAAIAVGLVGFFIWMMARMLKQFFQILPRLPRQIQELSSTVDRLQDDVKEALRERARRGD